MLKALQRRFLVVTIPFYSALPEARCVRAAIGLVLLSAIIAPAQSGSAASENNGLRVVVLEGEGSINNIAAHTAHRPVVKVVDANGQPVSRAVVTFTLPSSTGPGGTFLDGDTTFTASTDADGIAAAGNLTPNRNPGQFPIRVTATSRGETARATILQTNAASTAVGAPKKKIVIAAVVAGAVAGGVLAATKGKATPAPSTSSVVPGSPTFVPPK